MFTQNLSKSSDLIGALASGLCMIHCLATPFLFVAKSCTTATSCCSNAPIAWALIDYVFIFISFFAIVWTTKTTTKEWIKYALWVSWATAFILILDQRVGLIPVPEQGFYVPALLLVGLHVYNVKYCKCTTDDCCIHS